MKYSIRITKDRCSFKAQTPYNIQQISDLIKHFCLLHKRAQITFRSLMVLFLLTWLRPGWAGFEDYMVGGRWQAMAGSGVASCGHQPLFLHNPALLCDHTAWQISMSRIQLFSLRELALVNLGISRGWRSGGMGMSVQHFGNDLYGETFFALAAAHRMGSSLRLGAAVRYADMRIARYGSSGCFLVDVGVTGAWNPRMDFGFAVKNLSGSRLGRCQEPLPQTLQMGIQFKVSPALTLVADLYDEVRAPLQVRHGVEYTLNNYLIIRAGFTSASLRLAGGFAVTCGFATIDYAVITHPFLGLTHQFSVSFCKP